MNFVDQLAEDYRPVLEAVRDVVERTAGPLWWTDPTEPRIVTHTERPPFARVGPLVGDGVATATVQERVLQNALDKLVRKHGFTGVDKLESIGGQWSATCRDGHGTTLEFRCGQDARIWVDRDAPAS